MTFSCHKRIMTLSFKSWNVSSGHFRWRMHRHDVGCKKQRPRLLMSWSRKMSVFWMFTAEIVLLMENQISCRTKTVSNFWRENKGRKCQQPCCLLWDYGRSEVSTTPWRLSCFLIWLDKIEVHIRFWKLWRSLEESLVDCILIFSFVFSVWFQQNSECSAFSWFWKINFPTKKYSRNSTQT